MEATGALTHLLSSLELLASAADRAPGGLNDWAVLRAGARPSSRMGAAALDLVGSRAGTRSLHLARVAAAAVLLGPTTSASKRMTANALLAGSWAALYPRHRPSADGADAASFVVQTACALARTGGGRAARVDACLWFVAAQGALAYAASGWAKASGPRWRKGTALPSILRTHTFGHPRVHALLERHPRATVALSHAAMALECAFPLALLGPRPLTRGLLAMMSFFHVANAMTMGLNRFVPAFGATYWAVAHVAGSRRRVVDGVVEVRADTFPAAVAVGAALSAVGLQATARRRRAAVARGLPGERALVTASGSILRVRSCGVRAGHRPVLVLVHAVGVPVEAWEWMVRHLCASFTVVTYRRPGYGGSTGPGGAPPRAVDDLLEIVRSQPRESGVVLVGHREGALLAAEAASSSDVAGLVMIGPVPVAAPARYRAPDGALTAHLLRLGLGPLLRPPDWVSHLPADVRPAVLHQYRDPRLWLAAGPDAASLAAAKSDAAAPPGPVLVLAPRLPTGLGAPGAVTTVVPHADTLQVLLEQGAAERAADVLAGFVLELVARERPIEGGVHRVASWRG